MQLRTPKRSLEIITTRVSASLCAINTRQIYEYREARSAPLFARENAIQHDVIVQATRLVSHRWAGGAYHLTGNFENSGWKVNGKVTFRKLQPKIEGYIYVLRKSVHSGWYEPNGMLR